MGRYSNQRALVYGALLIVAGFALVLLGWRGAAATLFVPTQVAYVVSGGVAGIALIGTGAAMLNVHATRTASAERDHRLADIIQGAAATYASIRQLDKDESADATH